jgi:hypothetical protein
LGGWEPETSSHGQTNQYLCMRGEYGFGWGELWPEYDVCLQLLATGGAA